MSSDKADLKHQMLTLGVGEKVWREQHLLFKCEDLVQISAPTPSQTQEKNCHFSAPIDSWKTETGDSWEAHRPARLAYTPLRKVSCVKHSGRCGCPLTTHNESEHPIDGGNQIVLRLVYV